MQIRPRNSRGNTDKYDFPVKLNHNSLFFRIQKTVLGRISYPLNRNRVKTKTFTSRLRRRCSMADGRGLTSMADGRGRTSMAECRAGTDGRRWTDWQFFRLCAWEVSDEFYQWTLSFTVGNAVLALLLTAVGSTVFWFRVIFSRAREVAAAATFYLHLTSVYRSSECWKSQICTDMSHCTWTTVVICFDSRFEDLVIRKRSTNI